MREPRIHVLVTVYADDEGDEPKAELDWHGTASELYSYVTTAAKSAKGLMGLVSVRPALPVKSEAV